MSVADSIAAVSRDGGPIDLMADEKSVVRQCIDMVVVDSEAPVEKPECRGIETGNGFAIASADQHVAACVDQNLVVHAARCAAVHFAGPHDGLAAIEQDLAHAGESMTERNHGLGIGDVPLPFPFDNKPLRVPSIGTTQHFEALQVGLGDRERRHRGCAVEIIGLPAVFEPAAGD